jgi:hypothetical protein
MKIAEREIEDSSDEATEPFIRANALLRCELGGSGQAGPGPWPAFASVGTTLHGAASLRTIRSTPRPTAEGGGAASTLAQKTRAEAASAFRERREGGIGDFGSNRHGGVQSARAASLVEAGRLCEGSPIRRR